jgi:hypothetical protein
MEEDKYLDIQGLSKYSSLSVRTLRDYLADSSDPLPSYCVKRKILVKKSDFDGWIKKYRTKEGKIYHLANEVLNEFNIN